MLEKIARCVFWLVSLSMLGLCIYTSIEYQPGGANITAAVLGIITNPYIGDKFAKKVGAENNDYVYAFQLFIVWAGVLFAFIIAMFIFKITANETIDENMQVQNFESILRMVVFGVYLVILFACKNRDKFSRYIIFGAFYSLCVLISYASEQITVLILDMLNGITNGDLDASQYEILVNDILEPIKEAVLTFIIFETVMKERDNNKKTKKIKSLKKVCVRVKKDYETINKLSNFEITVLDNGTKMTKDYNIQVHKH